MTHERGLSGAVEILDRVSGGWLPFSSLQGTMQRRVEAFEQYSYGYQERFVIIGSADRMVLEPFHSPTFILGCAEQHATILSGGVFLTGGDEEEIWQIASDGKAVSIDMVVDGEAQAALMQAVGGALRFQNVEKRLLKTVSAAAYRRLLRVTATHWELVVKSWVGQYILLLDALLEMNPTPEARVLQQDRERLLATELGEASGRGV